MGEQVLSSGLVVRGKIDGETVGKKLFEGVQGIVQQTTESRCMLAVLLAHIVYGIDCLTLGVMSSLPSGRYGP